MTNQNSQPMSLKYQQSRYNKILRQRIIEHRDQQNPINGSKLSTLLAKQPDPEIRESLKKIHKTLNERFSGNRAFHSNTEMVFFEEAINTEDLERFIFAELKICLKISLKRGKSSYGNCQEYASEVQKIVNNLNLSNLSETIIISSDTLDHVGIIVELYDRTTDTFRRFILDEWLKYPIFEITKYNYSKKMPLELLLLEDEVLENHFMYKCNRKLQKDRHKYRIAKRILKDFDTIKDNDYLGPLYKMEPLLILINEFELIENRMIALDEELHEKLKSIKNIIKDNLNNIQEIEFDEQILQDRYNGNLINYLYDIVEDKVNNGKIPSYEEFYKKLEDYLKNNSYPELTESDSEELVAEELTFEETKELDFLLLRS